MTPEIKRIQKLQALADRTTYGPEREACLAKIAQLMQQHNLTADQVKPPVEEPMIPRPAPSGPVVMVINGQMVFVDGGFPPWFGHNGGMTGNGFGQANVIWNVSGNVG